MSELGGDSGVGKSLAPLPWRRTQEVKNPPPGPWQQYS